MSAKRLVVAFVAAVLGLFLALALPSNGDFGPQPALAQNRAQLSESLQQKRDQLQKAREAIKRADAVRKAALGDIAVLDQHIDSLEGELDKATRRRDDAVATLESTRTKLGRISKDLTDTRRRLQRTEADLQKAQATLDHRAVNIYKSGRLGYIEVLLNAHRLTEFVTRVRLFSLIVQQDTDVVEQVDKLRRRVTVQKQTLEDQQVQVAALEKQQAKHKAELDSVVAERQSRMDDLDAARDGKRVLLAKAEKDKASWEKQEDTLLAESDRIASDLRALSQAGRGSGGPVVVGTGQFTRPVSGAISSPFGWRMHPIFHVRRMHTGVDMQAGMGTPIHAADSGTVVEAGWRGGYGKTVVISHGNGLSTLYAHQSQILVSVGQTVRKGEVIGEVGSTGFSTGPHLHFEVRVNGSPVDPAGYL